MSATRAQHRRHVVVLLAVLLAVGVAALATDRARRRHATAERSVLAAPGAASERPGDGASSGLLSPFAPVLHVVVTALTGSETDAGVGRCVPRQGDSATRPAPGERILSVVARDAASTRTGPTFVAKGASVPRTDNNC